MKIFISWSGNTSKKVALLIKEYLEENIQATEPWVSTAIEKGKRWNNEIAENLQTANFGIICLTRSNLSSPWLLFESGALSKLENSRLFTFLVNVDHSDVETPLSQFQYTLFQEVDFKKLLIGINESLKGLGKRSLSTESLDRIFKKSWPELKNGIEQILESEDDSIGSPIRSADDKIDEILSIVRNVEKTKNTIKIGSKYYGKMSDNSYEEIIVSQSVSFNLYEDIQKALNERGYDCPTDGSWGEASKATLVKFQKANDLPIGNMNIDTLKALGVRK